MSQGMDFFGRQEQATRTSRWLVLWLLLAVVGIVLALHTVVAFVLEATHARAHAWHPQYLAITAGITLAVIGIAALARIATLRSGGRAVAELLGGRAVAPNTSDPRERSLWNVVEEMSIASGTPMPSVYVLADEPGINAFAAGWSPSDAAIAVTAGTLEHLTRDELQGVIAHEFSHIFHGDMRLNIRLMGVLFGIVCIATAGRMLLRIAGRSTGDSKRGAAGILAIGLAVLIVGSLGTLFARLIQAAVSRQREFLADASAVRYTRHPAGIGMALVKIGGYGAKLRSEQAESASHMLFADGLQSLFASHPPLDKRIERILPGYRVALQRGKEPSEVVHELAARGMAAMVAPSALLQRVGELQEEQVDAAARLLDELPPVLRKAAGDPVAARALVLAMLVDASAPLHCQQLAGFADAPELQVAELAAALRGCRHSDRLPLLELAIGSLRTAPAPTLARLRELATRCAAGDGVWTPFEVACIALLERHLPSASAANSRAPRRGQPLQAQVSNLACVLAALAQAGGEAQAHAAYAAGWHALNLATSMPEPPFAASYEQLSAALHSLTHLTWLAKRSLLTACIAAATTDGEVRGDELDLLRAFSAVWDCPIALPPVTHPTA